MSRLLLNTQMMHFLSFRGTTSIPKRWVEKIYCVSPNNSGIPATVTFKKGA